MPSNVRVVTCPYCEQPLSCPSAFSNQDMTCPHCYHVFGIVGGDSNLLAPPIRRPRRTPVIIDTAHRSAEAKAELSLKAKLTYIILAVSILSVMYGACSREPASPLVYVAIVTICVIVTRAIMAKIPAISPWRVPVSVFSVAVSMAAIGIWGYYETEERVFIRGDLTIIETHRRFRDECHYREVWFKEDGQILGVAKGPTALESGSAHGRWTMWLIGPPAKEHQFWFWYGEEVTESAWHLLNRQK